MRITIYTLLNQSAARQTEISFERAKCVQGKGNIYWKTPQKISLGRIGENIKNSSDLTGKMWVDLTQFMSSYNHSLCDTAIDVSAP